MSVLPADEDYARAILSLFALKARRPGQSIAARDVEADFLSRNMGRLFDYEAGLHFALEQNWLRLDCQMIRLSAAGFDEI
jgi:hypothetical protein